MAASAMRPAPCGIAAQLVLNFADDLGWKDDWKAIRPGTTRPIALYDLKTDLGETNNGAAQHPDVMRQVENILKRARTDNVHWKINERGAPGGSPFVEDRK